MFPGLKMFAQGRAIPKGAIILWSGTLASIPGGWATCNGTQGTPDLRDRFIVAKGPSYSEGQTGGSVNHLHGVGDAEHYHIIEGGLAIGADTDFGASTSTELTDISTDLQDGRPPYYCLYYIMKL